MKVLNTGRVAQSFGFALVVFALQASTASGAVTVTTNGAAVTVSSTAGDTFGQAFLAPAVETVTYNPKGRLTLTSKTPSTYTGGTTVGGNLGNGDLLLLSCSDQVFGLGDVTLVGSAALYANGADVTIPNRLHVTSDSLVGSFAGDGRLTVCDIGLSSDTYGLRLGRSDKATSTCTTLSLTEAADAMRTISLLGPVALTLDGGIVKMAEASRTPFLSVANNSSTKSPSLTVTTNGVAFSVPDGIRASLGLPADIRVNRRVVVQETLYPQSHDFENGTTGWGRTMGSGSQDGGRKTNGTAFDGEGYGTPDGNYYMMLRCGNVMTQVVENVTAGLWRMRFLCGCRKASDGPYSPQPVDVSIDGKTVLKIRESSRFPFAEYITDPVELADDRPVVISFAVGGTYSVGSMNIDRVILERIVYDYDATPIAKSGAGELTFAGERFDHAALSVSEGTLALVGNDLTNATATAKAGGRLAVGDNACATTTQLKAEAGGTLALCAAGTNLVENASFESNVDGWNIGAVPTGWTKVRGDCGCQRDGGTITPTGPFTPFGKETSALRPNAAISQTVVVPETGLYRLSFAYAVRDGYSSNRQTLRGKIDDEIVVEIPVLGASSSVYQSATNTVALTAGEHVLTLASDDTHGAQPSAVTMFDDVQLRLLKKPSDLSVGEVRLSSGSTLELDYDGAVRMENVLVDGVRVECGGKAALQAAGVTVTGPGKVRIGPERGLVLVVR